MKDFDYYKNLQEYIASGEFPTNVSKRDRAEMRRAMSKFVIKDGRLFYTGPNERYMRLVVLKEEEKQRVLAECHDNPGTGNHCGMRATRNRVIAGYYWATLNEDVIQWVSHCQRCNLNVSQTETPNVHLKKVKQPWELVFLDVIGPLYETDGGKKYVVTMTDLYSKWVAAESLTCKSADQIAEAIVAKMYTFGIIRKIVTNLRMETVNAINECIFEKLKIKEVVTTENHTRTNGKGEKINHSVKRGLRKYFSETDKDWDLLLPAVVYGLNTSLNASTRHTPFFLMFHRHPNLPEVMNACPMSNDVEVGDPEEDIHSIVQEKTQLTETVLDSIEKERHRKAFETQKRQFVPTCSVNIEDISVPENPKKTRLVESPPSQDYGQWRQDQKMD